MRNPAGFLLWIEESHWFLEFVDDDPHRFNQVRIAADHDRALEAMLIRVVQEVRGEVDVGTLLFSLEDLNERILSETRMDERQANRVGQEVTLPAQRAGLRQRCWWSLRAQASDKGELRPPL